MMNTEQLQQQINELNKKMDFLIDASVQNKLKRDETEDLISDLSLIGKDIYDTTVENLENERVELDDGLIKKSVFKFMRDIELYYEMMGSLENFSDLVKDLTPIINQVGTDTINKFAELEQKGYLRFFSEFTKFADSVVKNYQPKDIANLTEKMGKISDLSKNAINSSLIDDSNLMIVAYEKTRQSNITEMSLFKAFREMKKPEMKKSLGFMITFLENLSKEMNF